MKVIAINGSPHKSGNTAAALARVAQRIEKEGIDTELVQVGHWPLQGCMACGACKKTGRCVLGDDAFHGLMDEMAAADGLLFGAPVYYASIASGMKAFMDRAFYSTGAKFRHKVGGSVAVLRRSGGIATFNQLNNYLSISEMFIAPSQYWTIAHGAAPGEVLEDEEGLEIMDALGANMAYLIKLIELGRGKIEEPPVLKKTRTNFIR